MDIYAFLDQHGIAYQRFDHPAVFTCEQAQELRTPMPGKDTKNLFLRDEKGKRHFLVTVGHEKQVERAANELLHKYAKEKGKPVRAPIDVRV